MSSYLRKPARSSKTSLPSLGMRRSHKLVADSSKITKTDVALACLSQERTQSTRR